MEVLLSNVSKQLQGSEDIILRGGSSKSTSVAFILCLFFGWMGAHRFYVGKNLSGVLYLFTFGILGIGWFFDAVRIVMGNFTDKKGDYVSNW